ncbi:unnamed protein product, partial [Rotaria socialis]
MLRPANHQILLIVKYMGNISKAWMSSIALECRDVDNAYRVFASITNKSNYSYTAMFKGLRSNGMPEKIIDLLEEMKIEPDNFTLTLSFHACAQVANERAMRIGQKLIHKLLNNSRNEDIVLNAATNMLINKIGNKLLDELPDNCKNNTAILTSAIHMLMKFGHTHNAERVFELIQKKDVITYGAMLKGYVDNEMFEKALDLFEHMNCDLDHAMYTMA